MPSNSSSGSSSGPEDPHARVDLKLVDETDRGRASGSLPRSQGVQGAEDHARVAKRGLPVWLAIVVVGVLCLALIWQVRVAGTLESKVASLESELAAVSDLLDAHRNRLIEIRGGVSDLTARLESLRTLVDSEPGEVSSLAADATPSTSSDGSKQTPSALPGTKEDLGSGASVELDTP